MSNQVNNQNLARGRVRRPRGHCHACLHDDRIIASVPGIGGKPICVACASRISTADRYASNRHGIRQDMRSAGIPLARMSGTPMYVPKLEASASEDDAGLFTIIDEID